MRLEKTTVMVATQDPPSHQTYPINNTTTKKVTTMLPAQTVMFALQSVCCTAVALQGALLQQQRNCPPADRMQRQTLRFWREAWCWRVVFLVIDTVTLS